VLISINCNLWNTRLRLNEEAQFPINLMLNDEIEKKNISIKKKLKVKKIAIKIQRIKSDKKKLNGVKSWNFFLKKLS